MTRERVALGAAIVAFVVLFVAAGALSTSLGLSHHVDYGETVIEPRGFGRFSYDEESDGHTTDIVYLEALLSILLSWRIYRWVLTGNLRGDLSPRQRLQWRCWLIGGTAYIVPTTAVAALELALWLHQAIVVLVALTVICGVYGMYRSALDRLAGQRDG